MRQTLLSLLALFLAMATLTFGSGHLGSFLSLYMTDDGTASWIVGFVMSGYYIGLVVGAWVSNRVVQRVGHIRAFTVFAAINTAVVLSHAMLFNPVIWFLLRVATGVSMMGLFMIVESWLNERSPREIRGQVFSIYMVVTFFGIGGGQLMLNIGPIADPIHFFVIGILFSICLVPVALTRAMHPQPVGAVTINWSRVYKTAPFGIVGALVAGLSNGAFYAMGPVFARGIGYDVGEISVFMASAIFGGLILQFPVGVVSDRFDRRLVLAVLSLLLTALSVAILFLPSNQPLLLNALAVVFGGLMFTIYPVAVAHTHDHFDSTQVLVVSAALIVAYGLGAAGGPLVASILMSIVGVMGLFVFIAGTSLAFGIIVLVYRGIVKAEIPEQEPFVAVPTTSVVINSLDPRADEEQVDELPPLAEEDISLSDTR